MIIDKQNQSRDFKIRQRGKLGEGYVCDYLTDRGYLITATNFSCPYGEVDIIAQKNSIIAFVEVKTRTSSSLTGGFESITRSKRNKIMKTVEFYLVKNKVISQPRIDCAQVIVNNSDNTLVDIIYIENALEES